MNNSKFKEVEIPIKGDCLESFGNHAIDAFFKEPLDPNMLLIAEISDIDKNFFLQTTHIQSVPRIHSSC